MIIARLCGAFQSFLFDGLSHRVKKTAGIITTPAVLWPDHLLIFIYFTSISSYSLEP